MSELNQLLNAVPVPLVAGEKTYKVAPPTKNIQAAFEVWVEEQLWKGCNSLKATLGQNEYVKLLAETNDRISRGDYNFGTPGCESFGGTLKGAGYFFYLLLKEFQPTITEEEVRKLMIEFPAECERALKSFAPVPK